MYNQNDGAAKTLAGLVCATRGLFGGFKANLN